MYDHTHRKSYVDDVGTIIILNCGVSIEDSLDFCIKVKKPDKTEVDWPAAIYQGNYLKYVINPGDLDMPGSYFLQSYIENSVWKGRGETVEWVIYAKFK